MRASSSRAQSGSVILFALVTIAVMGALIAWTLTRVNDGSSRTQSSRAQDRAAQALDTGVQLAVQKIQRVGSAESDEAKCSVLDEPAAPTQADGACSSTSTRQVNGQDATDGEFKFQVRSPDLTGDAFKYPSGNALAGRPLSPVDSAYQNQARKRTLQVSSRYAVSGAAEVPRKKTVNFTIVPRVLRFALFSASSANRPSGGGASAAVSVENASLLLPPWYKSARDARGGDLGTNGQVDVRSGGSVNSRAAAPSLFDSLFVTQTGQTLPNGDLTFVEKGASTSWLAQAGLTDGFRRRQSVAVAVVPPVFTKWLRTQRCAINPGASVADAAASDAMGCLEYRPSSPSGGAYTNDPKAADVLPERQNVIGGQTKLFRPQQFLAKLAELRAASGSRAARLEGLIYVNNEPDARNEAESCSPGSPERLVISATDLEIIDGGLIVHGCDLVVDSSSSLSVRRNVTDQASPFHRAPAVLTVPNSNKSGGNLQLNTSGSARTTRLDGAVLSYGNFSVTADTPPDGGYNVRVDGAVVSTGTTTISGTSASQPARVMLRWNPIVQRTDFRADGNQMGTYAIRTYDRPKPSRPVIEVDPDSRPTDPTDSDDVDIQWTIIGDADYVRCSFDNGPQFDCSQNSFAQQVERDIGHELKIEACNIAGCGYETVKWFTNPAPPEVVIDPSSVPANPTADESATLRYSITGRSITKKTCTLEIVNASGTRLSTHRADNGSACVSQSAYSGLPTNTYYRFVVEACNAGGCTTDTASWRVLPNPPGLTITSQPDPPQQLYTSTSGTVTWNATGMVDQVQCRTSWVSTANPATTSTGAWANCGTQGPGTGSATIAWSNCRTYTFEVRATNPGGDTTRSATWKVKCPPATITITSAPWDGYRATGSYTASMTNARTCWVDSYNNVTSNTASSTSCGSSKTFSFSNKGWNGSTIRLCVNNYDGDAVCATDVWDRRQNGWDAAGGNGSFDVHACCWSGWMPYTYGNGGSWINTSWVYSAPNAPYIYSWNNGTYGAAIVTVDHPGRGDKYSWVSSPCWSDRGGCGYGYVSHEYWTGSAWSTWNWYTSHSAGCGDYRLHCGQNFGGAGAGERYQSRIVFWGTSRWSDWNAGYNYDNLSSTGGD